MNTYSAVLLDMDGAGGGLPPKTGTLLARLEGRGIPVALCSGRHPAAVDETARRAGLRGIRVCYGGSLVLDAAGNFLLDAGIPGETAVRFRRFAADAFPGIAVTGCFYGVWLADDILDPAVRAFRTRSGMDPAEGGLDKAVRVAGHVHKLLCLGAPGDLRRLRQCAEAEFPSLALTAVDAYAMEAASKDASLAAAMEVLCRRFHLEPARAVALGSRTADAELLRRAGLGIALGNVPEAVRQAADRATASIREEGVYIALKGLRFRPPERGADEF